MEATTLKLDDLDSLMRFASSLQTEKDLNQLESLLSTNQRATIAKLPTATYEQKRLREAERQRKKSAAAREIADQLVPLTDSQKNEREIVVASFKEFCERIFANRFTIKWSRDHLDVIDDIQRIVHEGGLLAVAMPRGSGKTSLLEVAMIWALVTGLHRFVVLLGATASAAADLLLSIRDELCLNDKLAELFPEVCIPLRSLEDVNQRRVLFNGTRVKMKITQSSIVLPNLPGSVSAGSVIRVAGILSRIRGMKHSPGDGSVIRPTLALGDDLQTDESARRQKDINRREKTLTKAVLGLCGPRKRMSAMLALTVIQPDDLADRTLDRNRHPEWNGRRTQLLRSFPTNKELWSQYAEIQARGLRAGDDGAAATEFYRANRDAMDEGADPAWPERFNPNEISAIQNCMNLWIKDPIAFSAEYQNEPIPEDESDDRSLTVDAILERTIGKQRSLVPMNCEYVGAGIDCQKTALYWTVSAMTQDGTPSVIDYGVWPEQRRTWFKLRDITNTIQSKFPKIDPKAQLYNAIKTLTEKLLGTQFTREDGSTVEIGRLLVDAGWETETVRSACEQSKFKTKIQPAFGRAKLRQSYWHKDPKPGEIAKHDYRVPPLGRGRLSRHVLINSNAWISRVTDGFKLPLGSRGATTLFEPEFADQHRMFAEHITAEFSVDAVIDGTRTKLWSLKPGETDNHWLDSTKESFVACCLLGADPSATANETRPTKKTKKTPRYAAI